MNSIDGTMLSVPDFELRLHQCDTYAFIRYHNVMLLILLLNLSE